LPEPFEEQSINHQNPKIQVMKVLMFGWEFPPHISGGLGTACFGLSQSLVRENVSLMFVVPRIAGGEPAGQLKLINASEVLVPFLHQSGKTAKKRISRKVAVTYAVEQPPFARSEKNTAEISYIEVDAKLDPYSISTVQQRTETVEKWNYVFDAVPPKTATRISTEEQIEEQSRPTGYTYNFSGTYGPDLMEEVGEYAKVGGELARQFPHDVIHAHDWMTFAAGIEAKKISGKPLIIHVHATEYDRSGNLGGPVFEWEKKGLEIADRVVAVSQWTKDILVSRYRVSPAKIEVVHNGVIASHDEVAPLVSPVGSHVVTFLGRVTHQKGPRYFVEAARKVAEEFPDAHFIVAGAGDLLPQTIERVAQLRMSDKFHFTGFLNKEWINRIWSMSNVYVMPSVSEPFGITPLEAIQAGVPVIVSNQSGVAEVMPHALKVNFWDTDALAESICSVLKYKSLSTMLKVRGEREIKELSWKKAAIKLKSLYEEVTSTL
jgi:glycogen(starch) synthase